MKKINLFISLISTLFLVGCSSNNNNNQEIETKYTSLLNGGFETSTLDGWTVEYGDAFIDDCISSKSTFSFANDAKQNQIPVNQEGNWYLCGKGYDGSLACSRTGAIRSNNFVLSGNGKIKLKLAAGALTKSKGVGAEYKADTEICYVGFYLAKNNQMVARQTNEFFLEHTEDYVDINKYKNGVYSTDNFVEYTVNLSKYLNEEMYIRIVDNDKNIYYGYISVDDICIGGESSQPIGNYYVKSPNYVTECEANSIYEIANGDFECGSLAGWTILEGQAFSDDGVNKEKTWWNEGITYDRDGNYHYGMYSPTEVGRMRSSTFILGGSGYITFKLGGCSNNALTYLSIYLLDGEEPLEVARYSNSKYWNFQFPFVENGMKLLNLIQYVADLTPYIGKQLYIEVVDNNSTSDDLGCITLDSIYTYYETKPEFYYVDHYQALSMISTDVIVDSEYQIINGSFETGDLTGWETSYTDPNLGIGEVTNKSGWWNENLPFNKKGMYLYSGETKEGNTGYIKSSTFTVGGIGKMSFLFGGAKNPYLCYIALVDANTDVELMRFSNRYYHDIGIGLINNGSNLMNMVQYVADISNYLGQQVYLKVVDNASSDWGLLTVDSFITYYENENSLPSSYYDAADVLHHGVLGEDNEYQVLNGDFETGDLTGWTRVNNIGNISFNEVWWNEWYSFDKEGTSFFSGWNGSEGNTGSLTSSTFTVGGINKISFKLGGAKNKSVCHVDIIDASTEETLFSYGNYMFSDHMAKVYYYNGQPIDVAKDGVYMANMVTYVADLSSIAGRKVKIRIIDNASSDWGLVFLDSFITYYQSEAELPLGLEAK